MIIKVQSRISIKDCLNWLKNKLNWQSYWWTLDMKRIYNRKIEVKLKSMERKRFISSLWKEKSEINLIKK